MNPNDEIDFNEMISLFRSAITHARRANDFVDDGERGEYAATGEAAAAYSDFRSLWLYVKVKDKWDRAEFDDLMQKAAIFQHELSNNVHTHHSHQWTDIEYGNLVKQGYKISELLHMNSPFTDQETQDYLM